MKRFAFLALLVGLLALPLFAQNPTGTLSGHVTDGKDALPGVTVSVSSPNMQGARTATTTENGDYIFAFLPPGEYQVKFELEGFQTLETSVKISAAQTAKLDATMPQAKVAEQITVAGSYETISTSGQAATTYEKNFIEKLPMPRDMVNTTLLAPGVNNNGPRGNITISGAQSYENLFLVNGVVVNENLRGQPLSLYIEDAIQETTTSTGSISAEYGRFSGGVVNALTKSGGNEISASVRVTLANDKWTAPTPLTVSRLDKINPTYEATLGGYFFQDKLWFFLAGRDFEQKVERQTLETIIPYTFTAPDKRYEGKLTFALNPSHRFIGSYMELHQDVKDFDTWGDAMDLVSLVNYENPSKLHAYDYTGVLSDNFFVEGQYSKRTFSFIGYGNMFRGDLIKGTTVYNLTGNGTWNGAPFCGACPAEDRNNDDILLKGSWFLSTPAMGTHDVVVGADRFRSLTFAFNPQSGSDYILYATQPIVQGQTVYSQFLSGATYILWWPVLEAARQEDFRTDSLFFNDKWRLNNNWTFNIGARFDKNHAVNADGVLVANDSKVSPRLGVTFDPNGDGDWQVNAGWAKYVNAVSYGAAGQNGVLKAGQPAFFEWLYNGPDINASGPYVSNDVALQRLFDWFASVGGTDNRDPNDFVYAQIPGLTAKINGQLTSPSADEMTIGVTKRLGIKGLIRVDLLRREFKNYYTLRLDTTTGQVTDEFGNTYDVAYTENDRGALERKYDAMQIQASYRFTDRLTLGGNYTLSKTYGNVEGETGGSGPVPISLTFYPEYIRQSWNLPKGDVSTDQRHKARVWLVWDVLATKHNRLTASLLQRYDSGTPYGAAGTIDSTPYVTNPGYASPPTGGVTYNFTAIDAYRTDTITSTDIALQYAFALPAIGKELEFFLEPRVTNVFNQHGVIAVNKTVSTNFDDSALQAFDPFNEKPAEGVNWQKGDSFGKPQRPADYQTPRRFVVSFGVRF
jgi:hypothetical protein